MKLQDLIAAIAQVYTSRGLVPAFAQPKILDYGGGKWLVIPYDMSKIDKLEPYINSGLERQISATTKQIAFIRANNNPVLLFVSIKPPGTLPEKIERKVHIPGRLQIGVDRGGNEIAEAWKTLGHVLVGGATGTGKSVFLRSIARQAIDEGMRLVLVDADEMTFSFLQNHKSLLAEVGTINSADKVLRVGIEQIAERQMIFRRDYPRLDNYWDLSTGERKRLPPVLVMIDEVNGLISASGGTNGEVANAIKQLVWRGRKFGIIVIVAGQTFEKAIVGPLRDQLLTKIAFRVTDSIQSRIILGRGGAERLKVPGRAITNRWGMVQTYWVDSASFSFEPSILKSGEYELLKKIASEFEGRMTFAVLATLGYSRNEAAALRNEWRDRGLVEIDKGNKNTWILSKLARDCLV